MIIPRKIDIDWLHSAVEMLVSGRYRHRREGKTLAYLMIMLGEVELGSPQNCYLYVGENGDVTQQVLSELCRIVRQLYPDLHLIKISDSKLRIGEQLFLFHPITSLCNNLNLTRSVALDRIFMDIDDRTQRRLDKEGKLTELFHALLPQLSYRRGDVI